jgi:hypothetical protein
MVVGRTNRGIVARKPAVVLGEAQRHQLGGADIDVAHRLGAGQRETVVLRLGGRAGAMPR